MRKTVVSIFLAFFVLLQNVSTASAATNFLFDQSKNNKFGIHILDESDLADAATLVNSSGGKWGYVTLVIREDERDTARYSRAFESMKELNLIPIVRIATRQENGLWKKPEEKEAIIWADFLNELPWPTKHQYVVLFNEPNHAKEWGGEVNPIEYAKIARKYWEELKKADTSFFVLPAGFDAAAGDTKITKNSRDFFDAMHSVDEYIFTIFDGWTSHSYPNPGFSGSPSDNGKMSIRGFEWEINYLSKYYLSAASPVFITETGWINNSGDQEKIAENYKQAFSEAWSDSRVMAVTPFLLRYDASPFNGFSWKIPGTTSFYPYFKKVLGMDKVAGSPEEN